MAIVAMNGNDQRLKLTGATPRKHHPVNMAITIIAAYVVISFGLCVAFGLAKSDLSERQLKMTNNKIQRRIYDRQWAQRSAGAVDKRNLDKRQDV
jgi:hypothetical protein